MIDKTRIFTLINRHNTIEYGSRASFGTIDALAGLDLVLLVFSELALRDVELTELTGSEQRKTGNIKGGLANPLMLLGTSSNKAAM